MFLGGISILLVAGIHCSAQHMNAKDGPCQRPATGAKGTACFGEVYKKSDEELKKLYYRVFGVVGVVGGDELVKLKEAQRLWLQFRDANCAAEAELYMGGSVRPMVGLACLEAVTRHRAEELNVMYGWRLEKSNVEEQPARRSCKNLDNVTHFVSHCIHAERESSPTPRHPPTIQVA